MPSSNKESGVLGISGISSDMSELEKAAETGNPRAQLALDMFHHRIRKFIGAYAAVLGGVDILIFTGGIGENGDISRKTLINNYRQTYDHQKVCVTFAVKNKFK